jgi:hypothetical protein
LGKPRNHTVAAQDIARDLADIAGQLASLKGEANSWLSDPNYNTLKFRLEAAHSAAEGAAERGTIAPPPPRPLPLWGPPPCAEGVGRGAKERGTIESRLCGG